METTPIIDAEIAAALAAGRAVVALESTLISHGLPAPLNRETACAAERAVRETGAVPATVAVLDGRIRIGLSDGEIARLAEDKTVIKASLRDLGALIAEGGSGATTVAATVFCAHRAGLRFFATGGIGGVHRGAAATFDISADLEALARYPVAVVCSGAKAILDIPATLEVLESRGVPVIGLGTGVFPAFWCRDSGLRAPQPAADTATAAAVAEAHWRLGISGGPVIANPPPEAVALPRDLIEKAITVALEEAGTAGIKGKEITPWLLSRIVEITEGRSLAANTALIVDNARAAAEIACAHADLCRREGNGG